MDDNKPVKYASIGITSKPDGTVSNINGVFSIKLDDKITDNDILKFSSIGYQSEAFLVGTLKQKIKNGSLVIVLKKAVNQLKQVSVISKRLISKLLAMIPIRSCLVLGLTQAG